MSRLTLLGAGKPPTAMYAGPFDGITFAALYGLKRFLTAYTGDLIRLRRDSDNAESDFGYVTATGLLDAAAIATWLSSATGYVVTWYDQSGNGRNATQATAGSQPAYVASGVNSLPTLQFDGSADYMETSVTVATHLASNTLFALCRHLNTGGGYSWVISSVSGNWWQLGKRNTTAGAHLELEQSRVTLSSGTPLGSATILSATYDAGATTQTLYVDGASQGANTSTTQRATHGNVRIGAHPGPTEYWNGYASMIGLIGSVASAANHNTIGNELATLYGLTWNTVS